MSKLVLICCLLAGAARAGSIRAVGVLGNSGVAGPGRMRVGAMPLEHCASGAAIDRDGALWLSGGDAINRVGLDGHLVERFPLEPPGSVVDSRTFAVLDGTLYFLARTRQRKVALFALPMKSGAKARRLAVGLPERANDRLAYCLAPQPLDGRLVLAAQPKSHDTERIGVWLIDPAKAQSRLAFWLKGSHPHGAAVDTTRRAIYIGGYFGLYVGGITHSNVAAITAVHPDGTKLSDAFPAPCTKTPATPTQFRGVISLAAGALWDSAWYGFLARLDMLGRGNPGRVVEWHHELNYPTQVLGIRDGWPEPNPSAGDPLLIATPMPDAFYFATWDRAAGRLRLLRRIGCLPAISSLGLSDEGWVTAGTARTQLWWRWGDAADAVPRKAELHVAVTPVTFHGGRCFALAAPYHLKQLRSKMPLPAVFSSRVGARNEASRVGGSVPMKQPVGASVQVTPGKHNAVLFATDAATKQIWRTDFWLPELRPTSDKWVPLAIEGGTLRAPTDITALTNGRLLVADGGRILLLEPKDDRYAIAWAWERWGDGPDAAFGSRLRFAVGGTWLLVSDTERHRLLWLDWVERRLLGQFGETDRAGDDAAHLAAPTLVAVSGTRAVVADAGNQRIVKLELCP